MIASTFLSPRASSPADGSTGPGREFDRPGVRAQYNQAITPDEPAAPTDEEKQALWAALGGLTQKDIRNLTSFASRQLYRLGLPTSSGEDTVQQAVLALTIGSTHQSRGRHPRPIDLADPGAFMHYLRGVVLSLVQSQRRSLENRFVHAPWEDWILDDRLRDEFLAGANPEEEVAFRDLSELLFYRLSVRIPVRLKRLLLAWREQQFDSDKIPLEGAHRRLRAELRSLAAEVMSELTADRIQCPSPIPAPASDGRQHR